jgi:hypothetical protein
MNEAFVLDRDYSVDDDNTAVIHSVDGHELDVDVEVHFDGTTLYAGMFGQAAAASLQEGMQTISTQVSDLVEFNIPKE